MKHPSKGVREGLAQRFRTHVAIERTMQQRCKTLLGQEHPLGDRNAKGCSLHQEVRDEADRYVASVFEDVAHDLSLGLAWPKKYD